MAVEISQAYPQKRPLGLVFDQLLEMGLTIRRVPEGLFVECGDASEDERNIFYSQQGSDRHANDVQDGFIREFPRSTGVTLSAPKIPAETHAFFDGLPVRRAGDSRIERHRTDVVFPPRAPPTPNQQHFFF